MKKLFNYLNAMKRLKKVSFDMSLARGLDYYTGVIYEIVLTDKTSELGSISGGGRYDNLIGMFCQHQIPAVGGSLGIERLFTIL
jgi:histidyl-tRNA synthetase